MTFPSLSKQFDKNFDQPYKEFWAQQRGGQLSLFRVVDSPVEASSFVWILTSMCAMP